MPAFNASSASVAVLLPMNPIDRILAYLSDPSGKRRAEQDARIQGTDQRARAAREAAGRARLLVIQFRATQAALSRRGK